MEGLGFPEVEPLLRRHEESTLRLPLSLRPLPPVSMSFPPNFLVSHADSHLLNVCLCSFPVLAHGGHGCGTNGFFSPSAPRGVGPQGLPALECSIFVWAWASVLLESPVTPPAHGLCGTNIWGVSAWLTRTLLLPSLTPSCLPGYLSLPRVC